MRGGSVFFKKFLLLALGFIFTLVICGNAFAVDDNSSYTNVTIANVTDGFWESTYSGETRDLGNYTFYYNGTSIYVAGTLPGDTAGYNRGTFTTISDIVGTRGNQQQLYADDEIIITGSQGQIIESTDIDVAPWGVWLDQIDISSILTIGINTINIKIHDNPDRGGWIGCSPIIIYTCVQSDLLANDGSIKFDQDTYSDLNSTAGVTVTDADLNTDPNTIEQVTVTIRSFTDAGKTLLQTFDLVLLEDGVNSNVFKGNFSFLTGSHSGDVLVDSLKEGIFTATYIDTIDSNGNIDTVRTDNAVYKFYLDISVALDNYLENSDDWFTSAELPVKITVLSNGTPVEGADVYINGNIVGQTDSNGIYAYNETIDYKINENITVEAIKDNKYGKTDQITLWTMESIDPKTPVVITQDIVNNWVYFMNLVYYNPADLGNILPGTLGSIHSFFNFLIVAKSLGYSPQVGDVISYNSYKISVPGLPDSWFIIEQVNRNDSSIYRTEYCTQNEANYLKAANASISWTSFPFVTVTMASPAVVYITNPNGQSAGYDENGNLTYEFPILIGTPGDEPFIILIPNQIEGTYTFQIIGTGNGTYHLTINSYTTNGSLVKTLSNTDDITTGETKNYSTYIDVTPPTIATTNPTNGATNVNSDSTITVTFSEDIMGGTNWIELINSSKEAINFTTSIDGNVLTITPTSDLSEDKYKLILHTGCVTDLAGNLLAGKSISFSVGTSPTITTTTPNNGTTNVKPAKTITVTFSETIKKSSNFWVELVNTTTGGAVAYTSYISGGNILVINPVDDLVEASYKVILHTGCVTDLAGNKLAGTSFRFSVGTSPTITSTSPVDGATNVNVAKTITITFSENIKKSSKFWVELIDSNGNTVAYTSYITNGNILVINPIDDLAANTTYKVKLHTGCVTDLAGNPIAAKIITFTTK